MVSVPWEQSIDFLAASTVDVLPGGATSYVYPRRIGNSPQDVTSFHPGQALWSKRNLPDIFYVLWPTKEWKKHAFSKRPDKKRDQAGNVVWELEPDEGRQPRALLDFKILPDKIGTNEEHVFFELWRRLDGRIRWSDILMRMERANRPKANAINVSSSCSISYLNLIQSYEMNAIRVWRPALGLIAWHIRGTKNGRDTQQLKILDRLTPMQKAANTTRGLSPGLIDPALGEAGGRIAWPALKVGLGDLKRQENTEVPSRVESDDYIPEPQESDYKEDGDAMTMPTKLDESFKPYCQMECINYASGFSKHFIQGERLNSKYVLDNSYQSMENIVEGPLLYQRTNNRDTVREKALEAEKDLEEEADKEYEMMHKPVEYELDYEVSPHDHHSFRDNYQALRDSHEVYHGDIQSLHNSQRSFQNNHNIIRNGNRAYPDRHQAFHDDNALHEHRAFHNGQISQNAQVWQAEQVIQHGQQSFQDHQGFKDTMRWSKVPITNATARSAVSETTDQDAKELCGYDTGPEVNDAESTGSKNMGPTTSIDAPVLPSWSFSLDQDLPQLLERMATNEIKPLNSHRKFRVLRLFRTLTCFCIKRQLEEPLQQLLRNSENFKPVDVVVAGVPAIDSIFVAGDAPVRNLSITGINIRTGLREASYRL
ncbi:hypothetical protein MMC26_006126 [Xylographa opegraphella]|nr:hypothetical protein [Xylographa opegraphella]